MENLSVSFSSSSYSRCKSCARVDWEVEKKQCDYCKKEMEVVKVDSEDEQEIETEEDPEKC